MVAKYLWILGSLTLIILGTIHLIYTFYTNKFSPRYEKLENEMKLTSPILTRQTTMWNAWVGFNASHSSGAMFIGLINFYIAIRYFSLFQADNLLFLFNILTIGFYVWLAKKYWFKIPLIGITFTLICYIISFIIIIMGK